MVCVCVFSGLYGFYIYNIKVSLQTVSTFQFPCQPGFVGKVLSWTMVESVLTLSIAVWYGNTTVDDQKRLNRVVNTSSVITGCELPAFDKLDVRRVLNKSRSIILGYLFKSMRT